MSARVATLTIRLVEEDDGGEYRCRVDFRRSRTMNTVMKLTIIVPPKTITIRDSRNQTVSGVIGPFQEGSNITLNCEAVGGRPPPNVTWWKGSTLLDATSTTIGRSIVRNELNLTLLEREDLLTNLTCQASNTNTTVPASSTVTIDLSLAPRSVKITTPYTPISAGDTLKVTCTTFGARPPARISWWLGQSNLHSIAQEVISKDGNITTSYLLLRPTSEDNGKMLLCRAQNPDLPKSALEDKWVLNILFAPLLSLALGASQQYEHIREGSDVYFDCNIQANPPVTAVRWMFQFEDLYHDPSNGIIVQNHSLLLRNVGRRNRGKYQCIATNSEGAGLSEEALLRVQFSPVCKSGQKMVYGIARHEEVNITCEVDADPAEVSFFWGFNNTAGSIDFVKYIIEGRQSIATYIPRTKMDYGNLYCRGQNNIGIQKNPCIFTIVPTGPPEIVRNCSITNQTSSVLAVFCVPGEDGGLKQRFHLEVYGTEDHHLIANVTSLETPFLVVQDLIPGSSYNLLVYAENDKGRSMPVTLSASTLFAAERITGEEQPLAISAVLAVLMGLVGALVLLAIVIIFIMKSRHSSRSSDQQQDQDHQEKIPTPKLKHFEDDSPDVIPSKPFCTEYSSMAPNTKTERIYENVDEKDHTYENIISRVHFVPKETYDDITYAELALPDNQQPFVRHRLDPPTEYADIDFQNSRGKFPECPVIDEDDNACSPLVTRNESPASLSAV